LFLSIVPHLVAPPPLLTSSRISFFASAPELDEADTVEGLLSLLRPGGLPKSESLAASKPILEFISKLLKEKGVLDKLSREAVEEFCRIASERLPLVASKMKEPSFDSEFMNDTCSLASGICSQCQMKGLAITSSPLKDLNEMDTQIPPWRQPTWNNVKKIDWKSGEENAPFFKKLNEDVRGHLLWHLKKTMLLFGKLDKRDSELFYKSTVNKTLWCSWRMMVPWISTNIFSANSRSTCPALDVLQNWIPFFDAVLETEEPEDLMEMLHEALFLISDRNLISANNLTNPEFSNFFPFNTKFQRLVTVINLGNCLAIADKNLRRKICGSILEIFKKDMKITNLDNLSLWKNPQIILQNTREVWNSLSENLENIFYVQKNFSLRTMEILKFLLQEAIKIAGPARGLGSDSFFGLLAIGSTSRGDRFPFSDVEFVVLYETKAGTESEFRGYLFFLFSIFEFLIVRFGESKVGFRIDPSEHLLESIKQFIGTVSEIFQMHVQNIWFESPGRIATSKELESGEIRPEIFTSLLNPALVNSEFGGDILFGSYLDLMHEFLETQVDSWTIESTKASLEFGDIQTSEDHILFKNDPDSEKRFTKNSDSYFPSTLSLPKTRHLASLLTWMDILTKIDLLEFPFSPETKVDVKLVCHKPIVVFAQCLKIFGNLKKSRMEKEHPSEIFTMAHKAGLISFLSAKFLVELLKHFTKLRARLHLDKYYTKTGEKKKFSKFSESEKHFLEFCQTIFSKMKTILKVMLFDKGFQKFQSWNSVMTSLSLDLVSRAVQVGEFFSTFQELWISCLDGLPFADGTRESTRIWKMEKEKLLECLLPKFSSDIFQRSENKSTSLILVDRIKGKCFFKSHLKYFSKELQKFTNF
jgi:hypothetical protein